jgi:sporulation integral membrane protein YlbJ
LEVRQVNWKRIALWVGLIFLGLGLVCFPAQAAEGAREAVEQCLTTLIPSLFPFLVLSSLVISLGGGAALSRRLEPLMRPLFRVSGAGSLPLLLGLLGGYPVGARTIRQMYDSGSLSRSEANRLLRFCNNCGPAFLLSTAGVAVFGSIRAGWLLWLGHVLSAFLLGILLPGSKSEEGYRSLRRSQPSSHFADALVSSVTGAGRSMLQLCAFVVTFSVLLRLLAASGVLGVLSSGLSVLLSPLGISRDTCITLLTGGLELTRGILALSGAAVTPAALALAAFLLAWGGISVHCQTLAVLSGSDLSFGAYVAAKGLQGVLAAVLTYFLAVLFPASAELVTVGQFFSSALCAGLGNFLVV